MRNYLLEYSEKLAINISQLCDLILKESNICFQIKKSASSVYANVREANYGHSSADMISKFEIALKEVYETEGWLQILYSRSHFTEEVFKRHRNLCGRIRRLLISSVRTLKEQGE